MNKDIAKRMKASREENNISRPKMAELCGVSSNTILNYETDRTPIPVDVIFKYAKFCGVSPDYLFSGLKDSKEEQEYKKEQIEFYKEQASFYKNKVRELEEKYRSK